MSAASCDYMVQLCWVELGVGFVFLGAKLNKLVPESVWVYIERSGFRLHRDIAISYFFEKLPG
jgi:hypothetical protein